MQPLEVTLITLLAIRIIAAAWLPPKRAAWRTAAMAALLTTLLAHVLQEGARWNAGPLYGFITIVVLIDLLTVWRNQSSDTQQPNPRWWLRGPALLGLAVAALPIGLLPVPNLPAPTGPFAVGTDAVEITLPSDVPRAMTGVERARARLWYPANTTDAHTDHLCGDTWLEHEAVMLPALARRAGLPGFALQHLAHVRTHGCWGAPAAGQNPLPIITFDHGRGGFAAQNTFLAEELASHGWLVVAVDHPGGAVLSVFRDGAIIPFDDASFGGGLDGAAYEAAIRTLGQRWIAETRAILDALERGEGPTTLTGRVDRTTLVTSGHSTGGGSAFGLCAVEPGCVTTIGLDPWMLPTPPELLDVGLDASILALFSDPALAFFEPRNREAFDRLAKATRNQAATTTAMTYEGAGHMDVTDVALLSPIADRLGLYVGPAPGRGVLAAVRRDVLDVLTSTATLPMGR